MDIQVLQDLRDWFKVGDEVALCKCKQVFGRERDEYYPLYCLAKSALDLNPLIASMETGDNSVAYSKEVDESYRTLVRIIIESLEGRIEAHKNHALNFVFQEKTKTFHCRRCGGKIGWEHPNIPGLFQFSSRSEGNEAEGICYDCWSQDQKE